MIDRNWHGLVPLLITHVKSEVQLVLKAYIHIVNIYILKKRLCSEIVWQHSAAVCFITQTILTEITVTYKELLLFIAVMAHTVGTGCPLKWHFSKWASRIPIYCLLIALKLLFSSSSSNTLHIFVFFPKTNEPIF